MSAQPSFHEIMQWTNEECRDFLERLRWPKGAVCPKCGAENPYKISRKSKTKNLVSSFFKCRSCRKQFTATVGTIFEDSHIPLPKWFAGIYLMCASKKGVSAHQLHRMLGPALPLGLVHGSPHPRGHARDGRPARRHHRGG